MAGHRKGDSDSASPPPRPKHSSRRGREVKEQERVMERNRDKDYHRKEKDPDRRDARFSEIDERQAAGGKDREREIEKEQRDRDRNRDRGRDRNRDKDKYTDRDRDRERDKDRGRDKHRGRDRDIEGERDTHTERKGNRDVHERSPNGGMSKERRSPRSHFLRSSAPSPPKKRSRSSSSPPPPQSRTSASSMRDEDADYKESSRLDGSDDALAKMQAAEADLEEKQKAKEKPSFEYSGKLAAETNKVRGVTLLFTEPPEARKPIVRWRLYIFKDGEPFNEPLYVHRQTCYLFGRERKVADVPTDHPSCSKQHAVIQYRLVEKEADGASKSVVRPYLMDLGSTNGTFVNGEKIEAQRYYELMEKDTIKFGNSSREYVLLHENSAG